MAEAVEIWTSIEGNDAAATKRLREAYHRWFTMCCCGHDVEKHDAALHCSVKSCECSGYDHLTGKPDHPCNPLPAGDPRIAPIRKQERERIREGFLSDEAIEAVARSLRITQWYIEGDKKLVHAALTAAVEAALEVEAAAKAIEARCCSFSDGDGGGPDGWADREYRRVANEVLEAAAHAIRKQERERALKQIDGIKATLHEHYHGGNDEQVEQVQGAITDARSALEDSDA